MDCEGMLCNPWNVQLDDVLKDFKFERGNQSEGIKRRDTENWTLYTWARVYRFHRGIGEGWACRKMVGSPESSKGRLIRGRASTLQSARTLESGEC